MREWFLSTELMGLNTMPGSTAGISQKARRESWKSRKAKGGGRSLEYHISNFELDVQYQLYCNEYGNTDYKEWEIEQAILKTGACEKEDIDAVTNAVKQGENTDELLSYWMDNGLPSEKNTFDKHTTSNSQSTAISDSVYSFLEKFIDYPAETIKKWETEGELARKLDDKLFSIQSEQQKLKEFQDKASWAGMKLDRGVSQITNDSYIKLDYYDIEVSAGHGALVIQEEQTDCISFSKTFITNDIGVNAKNVFLMPVRGDSMHPTLKNQSIIMVNRIEEFSGDGIYVFRFDSQLMVKRLQFTKTGLNVVSDNNTYDAWELTREELNTADFEIIGAVVWSGQRM